MSDKCPTSRTAEVQGATLATRPGSDVTSGFTRGCRSKWHEVRSRAVKPAGPKRQGLSPRSGRCGRQLVSVVLQKVVSGGDQVPFRATSTTPGGSATPAVASSRSPALIIGSSSSESPPLVVISAATMICSEVAPLGPPVLGQSPAAGLKPLGAVAPHRLGALGPLSRGFVVSASEAVASAYSRSPAAFRAGSSSANTSNRQGIPSRNVQR